MRDEPAHINVGVVDGIGPDDHPGDFICHFFEHQPVPLSGGYDGPDEDAGPTIFLHVPHGDDRTTWLSVQIEWSEFYAAMRRSGFEISWDWIAE